jgi:hypothetical protein
MYVCMYVCIYVCMYVYIASLKDDAAQDLPFVKSQETMYMYVCMYVCIYILHIHRHI